VYYCRFVEKYYITVYKELKRNKKKMMKNLEKYMRKKKLEVNVEKTKNEKEKE
jgi:hypothetical protein